MGHKILVPIDLVCSKPEPECYQEGATEYGTQSAVNIEQAHEFAREYLRHPVCE